MKKWKVLLLLYISICTFSGCGAQEVQQKAYDLEKAAQLIKPIEKVFLEATQKRILTGQEYAKSLDTLRMLSITYPDMPGSDTTIFEGILVWNIGGHTVDAILYPTIFHETFEVTQAYIDPADDTIGRAVLFIAMRSSNPHFADFDRDYIFHQDEERAWGLYEQRGTSVYHMGEQYSAGLLVPKKL